ncbi:MAG: cbb3-type cytochrome c oxidase subunit I [Leucothrix sp.]
MDITIATLLILCFLASIATLLLFVWSLSQRSAVWGGEGANVIFHQPGVSDKTPEKDNHPQLEDLDQSSKSAVTLLLASAVFWLMLGSLFGVIASIKLHMPEFLADSALLTFGRIRPAHLNIVMYGWSSLAGLGVATWMIPRLLGTPLRGAQWITAATWLWNCALGMGSGALLFGYTEGKEFLELHWSVDMLFVVAGFMMAVPLIKTLLEKQVEHLYVSLWYISAALVWFPVLFLLANIPGLFQGTSEAVMNWWFGHNVLGLWITPLALATAYYLIPKILGVAINSYRLSLIGFWGLALFYAQVGVHHLIGSPVAYWVQIVSIVSSVMMLVPVIAFATNMQGTLKGQWKRCWHSNSLRFVVFGVVCYMLSSVQGTLEALPAMNKVVHFTQYTVGHAHFGMYAFFSFIMFGAIYFIGPRIACVEWPHPQWIRLHFWLASGGIVLYVVALSIGGVLQGYAMNDVDQPFMASVLLLEPWLVLRSIAGWSLTVGHGLMAINLYQLVFSAPRETAPTPLPIGS